MVTQLTLLLFLAHQRFASVQMKSPTMFWQKPISQGRCHGTFPIKADHSSPIFTTRVSRPKEFLKYLFTQNLISLFTVTFVYSLRADWNWMVTHKGWEQFSTLFYAFFSTVMKKLFSMKCWRDSKKTFRMGEFIGRYPKWKDFLVQLLFLQAPIWVFLSWGQHGQADVRHGFQVFTEYT